MTATVDHQICIGCTLCTQICPAVFRMETDKAIVYENPVSGGNHGCARSAAEQCPVQAIAVIQ